MVMDNRNIFEGKKLLKSSQWLLYWFYNIFYALLWKKKNIYGISGVGINIYETPGDAKVYVTTHTVPGIGRPPLHITSTSKPTYVYIYMKKKKKKKDRNRTRMKTIHSQ
eukprot:234310_1